MLYRIHFRTLQIVSKTASSCKGLRMFALIHYAFNDYKTQTLPKRYATMCVCVYRILNSKFSSVTKSLKCLVRTTKMGCARERHTKEV